MRVSITKNAKTLGPSVMLIAVALLATWMGDADGGYFVHDWAIAVFVLAAVVVVVALSGVFRSPGSRWGTAALGLFAVYAIWTTLSLFWSPNQGDAWIGAGQTFLYLLGFGAVLALLRLGASRRWALAASVLGPSVVAAATLLALVAHPQNMFKDDRLVGSVGYYNGEAAFLLVPFWIAVYLGGSRCVNPLVRGLVLAGGTLCVETAVLTQSRGALVAMVVSLPVFFAFSGQRVRGLLALIPMAAALLVSFPELNAVYQAFLNNEDPAAILDQVTSTAWITSAAAGLYGLVWGVIDRFYDPPARAVRVAGILVTLATVAALAAGVVTLVEEVGNPAAWGGQKWEAFKTDNSAGQEQSRYLSASGSGRYALWQVIGQDFVSHPLIGVGTHNYEATYYQLRERDVGYARQPHILPLEVLGERGIIGGGLFFGFLIVCAGAGLHQRYTRLDNEGKVMVGALTAAVTYWFVHSCAEWFWQLPAVTLPAIVYLAVLVAPWVRTEPEQQPLLRWPRRVLIAALAVLTVAFVLPLYAADHYLAQSYTTANPWLALESVERAQRFDPVNPQLPQREAELAMQVGNWPRVEKAYNEASRLNPEHYAPYTLLAKFYEQRGQPEKALPLYREALALNPLDKELNQSVTRLEARGSGA